MAAEGVPQAEESTPPPRCPRAPRAVCAAGTGLQHRAPTGARPGPEAPQERRGLCRAEAAAEAAAGRDTDPPPSRQHSPFPGGLPQPRSALWERR